MTNKQIELSFLYRLQESTIVSNKKTKKMLDRMVSKLEQEIQNEQLIPLY